MIVRIYRRDLVAANACPDGIAIYDAIAAMAAARGGHRAPKRLRIRWTPLHALWLATAYPSHSRWLVEHQIVPSLSCLARANLAGTDLAGADLARARLARANLAGADLARANLAGADLAGADLVGANLARADLARAYLVGAYLVGAYLVGANLAGAYLAGCRWPSNRTAPAGWTHDSPRTGCDYVVLRRIWHAPHPPPPPHPLRPRRRDARPGRPAPRGRRARRGRRDAERLRHRPRRRGRRRPGDRGVGLRRRDDATVEPAAPRGRAPGRVFRERRVTPKPPRPYLTTAARSRPTRRDTMVTYTITATNGAYLRAQMRIATAETVEGVLHEAAAYIGAEGEIERLDGGDVVLGPLVARPAREV
jgi:hypothetical protein